jgi:hypothetical protein
MGRFALLSERATQSSLDLAAELARLTRIVDAILQVPDRDRQLHELAGGAVQNLLASAVRLYVECLEHDPAVPALPERSETPSATDVLMTVTALLDAVQIEPFELGLWATWGFRGDERRSEEAR